MDAGPEVADRRGSIRAGRGDQFCGAPHGVHPNQLYAWRRGLREVAADGWDSPVFAPVVVSQAEPDLPGRAPKDICSTIEVEIAGAVVRVTRESDLELLTAVARALKAAALRPWGLRLKDRAGSRKPRWPSLASWPS